MTEPLHAESGFLALFRSLVSGLSQLFHNPITEELPVARPRIDTHPAGTQDRPEGCIIGRRVKRASFDIVSPW